MAQVFDLLYGTTLRGKSKAVVELIRYLHKQSGKKALAYVGDGGTETYLNAGLVEAGVLDVIEFDQLDYPFTVADMMTKGWAPDPANKGKWGPQPDYKDKYILTVFEGATVLGKYLMGSNKGGLAYRAGQGELIGNKNDDAVVRIKDDDMGWMGEKGIAVGGNTMSHYRLVQPRLLEFVKQSKKLPGWVIWTAHPVETYDKDEGGKAGDYGKLQGKTLVGPEFAGKALASWVSREFGNTLHFDVATKFDTEKDSVTGKMVKENEREYRIYTRDHYDPDGNTMVEYRAGNRCAIPSMMPDFLKQEKDERAGFALVRFYQTMAEARAKEAESLKSV